ncbi:hypothetical protein GQ600_18768 [Phytophthora cactorum]|nr:hypothetical protein GQ600_18768 [Phytophthora cactorum]
MLLHQIGHVVCADFGVAERRELPQGKTMELELRAVHKIIEVVVIGMNKIGSSSSHSDDVEG